MSNINPFYNDRVRFSFQHMGYGNLANIPADEIIGWNEDGKEYAVNDEYKGIFAKFSNALKFTGSARTYINQVRKIYGVNAPIRLVKDEKDNQDRWVRAYSGFLSMPTWNDEDGKVSLKFESGGLERTLKVRQKDKVEIERTTTIDGRAIPELELKQLSLPGRRILLDTKFTMATVNNEAKTQVASNAGNTRRQSVGLPLVLASQSHDLAHNIIVNTNGQELTGTTGMMFYANNDRDRIMQINISDLAFNAWFQQYENVQWCRYKLCLTKYENGAAFDMKERVVLSELRSVGHGTGVDPEIGTSYDVLPADTDYAYPGFTIAMQASYSAEVELLEGESLALECLLESDMFGSDVFPRPNAGVRVYAQNITGELQILEDSSYPASITKGILAYELLERLVEIMTGDKTNFKSDYFGRVDRGYAQNGPGAFIFFSHGHWIRQFEAGDELYKPFQVSFKDAFEALNVMEHVGLGIERIGFKERIIIEDAKYFYNNNVTIRLGKMVNGQFEYLRVNKLKRYVNEDRYFSSIKIGPEKGGEYEEVMGLEETNTMAEFTTIIEAVDNTYTKTSKIRWDNYGEEIIRRRNKITKPTTDQSGDLHIWAHDAKPGQGDIYVLKTWQDVLAAPPEGMFDPESAYNFLWSPVNLILKHGWVLNGGLREYPLDKIRYANSIGKSGVVSQQIGGNPYAENGAIPNSDLEHARVLPEDIEFEFEVDTDLLRTVEGYSIINGMKVPNLYGLVEFKNEEGVLERGKIANLKPNKQGKWKLEKSRL